MKDMNCPAIKCIFNIKLLIINLYYIIIKKKILLINYLDCKYFKWYSIQWIKYKKNTTKGLLQMWGDFVRWYSTQRWHASPSGYPYRTPFKAYVQWKGWCLSRDSEYQKQCKCSILRVIRIRRLVQFYVSTRRSPANGKPLKREDLLPAKGGNRWKDATANNGSNLIPGRR